LLEKKALHKKNKPETRYLESKKDFVHIQLPAKLLDYFLRSNKSNTNQSSYGAAPVILVISPT